MRSLARVAAAAMVVLAAPPVALLPTAVAGPAPAAESTLTVLGRDYREAPAIAALGRSTVVAFTTTEGGASHLVVKHLSSGRWRSSVVPTGTLSDISKVQMAYDPASKQVVLVALASGPAAGEAQSLFAWRASSPKRFGPPQRLGPPLGNDGKLAFDGEGGFWMVTNITNDRVSHVTAGGVTSPELLLSDRIASRAGLELATVGSQHVLLSEFEDGSSQMWVHPGVAESSAVDVRVMTDVYGPVGGSLAGDAKAAVVAGVRSDDRLWVRRVAASGAVGRMRAISAKDEVVSFSVDPVDARQTGRFRATWVTADGVLKTRVSKSADPSGRWGATSVIAEPGTKKYFTEPVSTTDWTSFGAADGKGYLVAVTSTRATR